MKPIYVCPLDMDRSIYRELPPPHHEEIIVNGEEGAMMLTSLCEHVGKEQHHGVINARETARRERDLSSIPPCPEEGERSHAAGVLCHHGVQFSLCGLLTAYVRKARDPGECDPGPPEPFGPRPPSMLVQCEGRS